MTCVVSFHQTATVTGLSVTENCFWYYS